VSRAISERFGEKTIDTSVNSCGRVAKSAKALFSDEKLFENSFEV
jgi:hypothetical protein